MTFRSTDEIKHDLRAYYDADAEDRNERGEAEWRETVRAEFAERLRSEGKWRLLEIGAGPGYSSAYFVGEGFDVVATDLAPEHVALARAKGVDARVADFYDLPFEDGSFDAMWAISCLLHVPDADLPDVLEELSRVLLKRGILQVGLWAGPNHEGIWEDDPRAGPTRFYSLRTDDRVRELFGETFTIESFASFMPPETDLTYQLMLLRKP